MGTYFVSWENCCLGKVRVVEVGRWDHGEEVERGRLSGVVKMYCLPEKLSSPFVFSGGNYNSLSFKV